MLEDTSFIPGSVCWVDVSTVDPAGSRDFYAGLFGWTYQIDPHPRRGQYTTALIDGRPVAGLAGIPASAGQPVTWMLYLTSANIEHTTQVFGQWGGRVLYGPTAVPGQGNMLIGADPTGAAIGFWQPAKRWMFRAIDIGALFWAELNTPDGKQADEFFANLFGYGQQQIGDGIDVDYTTWSRGEQMMLGRLQIDEDWSGGIAAHWMLHFVVDPHIGTDAAVNRVLELGGQVNIYPYNTELGRIARVADPFGAAFALIDPTTRLEPTMTSLALADDLDD